MANIGEMARTIYSATKDNEDAEQTIRDELASLALAIATNPNSTAQVTSSTVNGQQFSTTQTMTNASRLLLLREVVKMYDQGHVTSSTAISVFP